MATEASDRAFVGSFRTTTTDISAIAGRAIYWLFRSGMFALYALLFLFTLVTVGFIEIRQANMAAFNSLIAALEQRDAYRNTDFPELLAKVEKDRTRYQNLLNSLDCPKVAAAQPNHNGPETAPSPNDATNSDPVKLCNKIKNDIQDHLYSLAVIEDDLLIKIGTLEQYYIQYKDGITQQAPQIIPVLQFLNSGQGWINALARSPFEIMEMLLLVCMGMLGGVISVMRYFVEKSLPNPSISDLLYKPAMGGAVALGIYVLFRASQLFIAGQVHPGGVASTSIFLVAGLGLASGVCASDAIGQIEALSRRLLRRSRDDHDDGKPGSPEVQKEDAPAPDRPKLG